ncbi:restriction endonuclease [Pseudoalteromonas sp. T1lg48]|uniref:restriction endonuclease n=1 Tax=Pseudoalteromonas sp. T1lg48 TaxID=2077100 RepID=UPI000CF70C34|nr:restriction endonuclease [Pseudoalteromonas sp. T1lg48]
MEKVTASNLAMAINSLDKNVIYDYPNPKTKTKIKILHVKIPEGPISIKRCDPNKGESFDTQKEETISSQMLWRLANAIKPNYPINIDRVFGASYNTRSALEALLLHTEKYYLCYPGRLERTGEITEVKNGHKHIIYSPDDPHPKGQIGIKEVNNMVISDIEREFLIDSLLLNHQENAKNKAELNIQRRHAHIQVLLIKCAEAMGLKSWVAKNDHSIEYNGQKLIELDSVIKDLSNASALRGYDRAAPSGELIDIIWFDEEGKKIPAIIEIEHSTGITSGLTRMKGFQEEAPELAHMTYIIVAPDEMRSQVMQKASKPQFEGMNVKFLPYSAVEDLYLLCQRKLKGIDNIKFLHTFLEDVN